MQTNQLLNKLNIQRVLMIALVLRVLWALFVPVVPVSDSVLYDLFAQSIASGNGFAYPSGDLTAYWPVGTSAIYAVLYKIFGLSYQPIVLLNIVIGTAIVWLSYAIAKRYLSQQVALIAALLVALWPILIQFTTILASELIFILLILLSIYIFGCKKIPPVLRAIIWGALVCAATYVRPTALLLLMIYPVVEFLSVKSKLTECVVSLCIASITAALLFAPWVARNQALFGEFVLVSANGGVNLWMGNNPESSGGYMELTNLTFKNEAVRDQYFKKSAIDFIIHNPLSYIKLAYKRAAITYKAETIGIVWNGYFDDRFSKPVKLVFKIISSLYWWLIVALASIGIYLLLHHKTLKPFHLLFVVFAFFLMFPILTVAQDRYHLPINPFLAMFAAYAVHHFLKPRPEQVEKSIT